MLFSAFASYIGTVMKILGALLSCLLGLAWTFPAAAIKDGIESKDPDGVRRSTLAVVASNKETLCTAVAIAPRLALTAAHCVSGEKESSLRVRALDRQFQPHEFAVSSESIDPQFNDESGEADIAILHLREDLPDWIEPAHLAKVFSRKDRPPGLIAGFGGDGSPDSKAVLREGELLLAELTRKKGFDPEWIAAYNGKQGERVPLNICIGDSGGPVFAQDKTNMVFGILSRTSVRLSLEEETSGVLKPPACSDSSLAVPVYNRRAFIDREAMKGGQAVKFEEP